MMGVVHSHNYFEMLIHMMNSIYRVHIVCISRQLNTHDHRRRIARTEFFDLWALVPLDTLDIRCSQIQWSLQHLDAHILRTLRPWNSAAQSRSH